MSYQRIRADELTEQDTVCGRKVLWIEPLKETRFVEIEGWGVQQFHNNSLILIDRRQLDAVQGDEHEGGITR